ncbi:MAG: hypothetical protein K2O15_07675, partial [Lachnospiraceae bacterium]|nr:hypothetical protein [Lachnospiraceae bacterium]
MMNHAYPESTRIEPKEIKTGAGRAGLFAFATGGVKGDSVHCMFILPVNDNMMFGSYHFPAEEMERDRKFFLQMLRSIRVEEVSPMERQGVRNETGI